MDEQGRTNESRVLDHLPQVRTAVLASPEFQRWLAGLENLEVDGETLYLRGGDMLRDKEQVIFEWARKQGLLTDEAIQASLDENRPPESGANDRDEKPAVTRKRPARGARKDRHPGKE